MQWLLLVVNWVATVLSSCDLKSDTDKITPWMGVKKGIVVVNPQ